MPRPRLAPLLLWLTALFPLPAPAPAAREAVAESYYGWSVVAHATADGTGAMYLAIVQDGRNSLVAKCDRAGPGSIYVGFYADRFLGGGTNMVRSLQYRLDGHARVEEDWTYDWSYAHLVEHRRAMDFLARLEDAHELEIDAVSANFDLVVAHFDVTGAALAIGRLRELCRD